MNKEYEEQELAIREKYRKYGYEKYPSHERKSVGFVETGNSFSDWMEIDYEKGCMVIIDVRRFNGINMSRVRRYTHPIEQFMKQRCEMKKQESGVEPERYWVHIHNHDVMITNECFYSIKQRYKLAKPIVRKRVKGSDKRKMTVKHKDGQGGGPGTKGGDYEKGVMDCAMCIVGG